MPAWAVVVIPIVSIGAIAFLANGIRTLRRRQRNLIHWEKGEPLEGGRDDWD